MIWNSIVSLVSQFSADKCHSNGDPVESCYCIIYECYEHKLTSQSVGCHFFASSSHLDMTLGAIYCTQKKRRWLISVSGFTYLRHSYVISNINASSVRKVIIFVYLRAFIIILGFFRYMPHYY